MCVQFEGIQCKDMDLLERAQRRVMEMKKELKHFSSEDRLRGLKLFSLEKTLGKYC